MSSALGYLLVIAGAVSLSPLLVLPFYPAEVSLAVHFLIPALALGAPGAFLACLGSRSGTRHLTERDGSVVVTVGWLLAAAAGAWPFIGISGLSFSQAFFESMSGWTTTGLSMVDVEHSPRILLLYRSVVQLAGGAGLAIIMMAAFSLPVGAGLYRAEGRSYQLVPNVTRSAKAVVALCAFYAAAGTAALVLAGLSPFDAVNHAFCAVSTGGFSTRAASVGYWDSPVVESVLLVLMVLGNLNFLTAYALFRGRFRSFLRNAEVKLFALLSALSVCLLFFLVVRGVYGALGKEVRVAAFEAVSALTTTGFSTVPYGDWNVVGFIVMVALMIVGGGICSTAGSIKQYRVYIMVKAAWWELRRMVLPKGAVVAHSAMVGDEECRVTERGVMEIGVFSFLSLATFAVGTGLLAAAGYGLRESAFEFASSLGTVGLSLGLTSTTAPPLALWTMSAGMFLGRLEFFVVFVSISRIFRRRP